MKIFTQGSDAEVVLAMQLSQLKMLLAQTAANIILSCATYPTEGRPSEGASGILEARTNWADHGYNFALRSQVELIYAIVHRVTEEESIFRNLLLFNDPEHFAPLLAEALQAYQDLRSRSGSRDGKDWTDQNETLLALIRPLAAN